MARRRTRNKPTKSGLGTLPLFITLIVLAAVAYFLDDFFGMQFKGIGSYVWILAFLLAFTVGINYFATFLLPMDWKESWAEGLQLLISYNFPMLVGKPKSAAADRVKNELPEGFSTHRAGILPSHQVVALAKGSAFTRPAGPGYVRLRKGEIVIQIIDLRRHLRTMPVKAMTRDGIEVETSVTALFQVRQARDTDDPQRPYPYDKGAIFHINYLDNFSTGADIMPWSDHVCRQAADILVAEMANYTLDELYQYEGAGVSPLEIIKDNIERQLRVSFPRRGVDIILVGVGGANLPRKVVEQRIKYWRSRWQSEIKAAEAEGRAAAITQMTLARARAQIEMIERITEGIVSMRAKDGGDLSDIVALRMIEAVEEAVGNHAVQALVPDKVLQSLKQINSWVEE